LEKGIGKFRVAQQNDRFAGIPLFRPARFGLSARVAMASAASAVAVTILVASVLLLLAERGMKDIISADQFSWLTRAADEIDLQFSSRQARLQFLSAGIPQDSFDDPSRLQRYLEQHASLQSQFDDLLIFDARGKLVADLNRPKVRDGIDLVKLGYVNGTLRTQRGVISLPLRDPATQTLVVAQTHPIVDGKGLSRLVMMGLVNSERNDFLGKWTHMKSGRVGHCYIVTSDGTIVAHPDPSRVLQHMAVTAGRNPALARAFAGFEGSIEAGDGANANELLSFKRLQSTNWIIGAASPDAEIFAPIARLERQAMLAGTVLALVVGSLAWWITRRQIAPLHALHGRILAAIDNPARAAVPPHYRKDAIGDLAQVFDHLVREQLLARGKIDSSEAELRAAAIRNTSARERDEMDLRHSRAFLQTLIDHLPVVVFAKSFRPDSHDQLVVWNKTAETVMGYPADQVIGKSNREIFPPKVAATLNELDRQMLAEPKVTLIPEFPYRRPDGVMAYLQSISVPLFGEKGEVEYILGIVEDVTARRKQEQELLISERWLRSITDNLPALIAYVDQEERYRFCNSYYETTFNSEPGKVIGRTARDVLGERGYALAASRIAAALKGERVTFEREHQEPEGNTRHWRVEYIPDRQDGKIAGFYAMVLDITELKQVEHQLRTFARLDTLTGLANRHHFNEKLTEAIARTKRSGAQMALLYLDIDHFKSINDSLGHHGGDAVLREFSQRLTACIRQSDTVARLAGDEFVIILEGRDMAAETVFVAEKIMHYMKRGFAILGTVRAVTTSIGIAIRREGEVDAEALLRRADEALYDAKSAGRQTFKIIF